MASGSSGPYPWEADSGYSWDAVPQAMHRDDSPAGSGSEDDEEVLTPDIAGQRLLDYLEQSHASGIMSAKSVCTIAYWGFHAGLACLEDVALSPESSTGNFQKKLKKLWHIDDSESYVVEVPAQLRHDGRRGTHSLRTFAPHDLLAADLLSENIPAMIASTTLPPNYKDHAVVKAGEEKGVPAVPLALYLDGVRFGKSNQSVLGISVQNMLSGRRYLCVALRKSLYCGCGCKGWCTLAAIYAFLSWSFRCMAQGFFPDCRHDFRPLDATRAAKAGTALGWVGALLQIRADWAEWANSIGVFPWSHNSAPCLLCKQDRKAMLEGVFKRRFTVPLKTWQDYDESCQACEHRIEAIPPRQVPLLAKALISDARKEGNRGQVQGSNEKTITPRSPPKRSQS